MTERTTIAPAPSDAVESDERVVASMDQVRPVGAVIRLIAYLLDALIVGVAIYVFALVLRGRWLVQRSASSTSRACRT